MPGTISRRKLLPTGGQAIVAGGTTVCAGSALPDLPGGSNTIVVGVWMMQPGEDLLVAKRLREVLQGAVSS